MCAQVFEQLLKHGPAGTLDCFFQIMQWSFTSLQSGKFPEHKWDGTAFEPGTWEARMAGKHLANGFSAHLAAIQGDLDFFAAALSLPRWSLKAGGRPSCQCTLEGVATWQKFNSKHHVLELEWTATAWKNWTQKSTCKLFSIPHVTGCNVFLDYLHLKYLGSDMYMFGGLLWLMTFCLLPGQPLSNLEHIWSRMKFWYAKQGVQHRYHYFNRLTMFVRKSGAPKLRGRAVEVLGLNHVMVKIWEETLNPQVEVHRMILQMFRMNNKMEDLLHIHRNDTVLPAASAAEFVDAAFKMAHLNNLIHEHFKQEPDIPDIFAITIKLHMVLHVALHSHQISPRLTWNFTGEDEMGILKVLGQNCCKGVQPEDVASKMLLHWRYGMHLEMGKV